MTLPEPKKRKRKPMNFKLIIILLISAISGNVPLMADKRIGPAKVQLLGIEAAVGDRLLLRGHEVTGDKLEYWVEYLIVEINTDGKAIKLKNKYNDFWQSVKKFPYDCVEILPPLPKEDTE